MADSGDRTPPPPRRLTDDDIDRLIAQIGRPAFEKAARLEQERLDREAELTCWLCPRRTTVRRTLIRTFDPTGETAQIRTYPLCEPHHITTWRQWRAGTLTEFDGMELIHVDPNRRPL